MKAAVLVLTSSKRLKCCYSLVRGPPGSDARGAPRGQRDALLQARLRMKLIKIQGQETSSEWYQIENMLDLISAFQGVDLAAVPVGDVSGMKLQPC